MGEIDKWGFFHVDPRRIRNYIVPSLRGFQLTPYVSHLTEKPTSGNRNTLSPLDFFNSFTGNMSPSPEAIKEIRPKKPPNLLSKVMAKLAQEEQDLIYQGFKKDKTLLDTYLSNDDLRHVGVNDTTLMRKPYNPKKLK